MNYGMKVRIRFKKDSMYVTGKAPAGTYLVGGLEPLENGDTEYLRNVTEIHFGYRPIFPNEGTKVAFESDVHRTGLNYAVADIAEFETSPETEIANHF